MPIISADKAVKQVNPRMRLWHKFDCTGFLSVVSVFMIFELDRGCWMWPRCVDIGIVFI